MNSSDKTIATEYIALVNAMGAGFHPDTRGDDYSTLPEGYSAEDVDRIVDAAFEVVDDDFDVYGTAYGILFDQTH